MNAIDIDCDGCNAEAGEPCREWCIGEAYKMCGCGEHDWSN